MGARGEGKGKLTLSSCFLMAPCEGGSEVRSLDGLQHGILGAIRKATSTYYQNHIALLGSAEQGHIVLILFLVLFFHFSYHIKK